MMSLSAWNMLQKFIVFYGIHKNLNSISKMECFLEKRCKVPEQHFKQEFLSTVYKTRSTPYQHRSTSVQHLACMPLTPAMKINTAHGRIS